MTQAQAKIIELFETLAADEQRALAEQLYEQTLRGRFYGRMTLEQRAQLEAGVAEADRGDVVASHEAFDRIASRLGIKRA